MVHERGKSLLQKLNLDVDELDYKFIKGCEDPKKLENILRVLRSGEEGLFPDLIRFCEDHLRSIAPNSSLLQEVKGVVAYADLPPEEAKLLLEDIKDWSGKSREQNLVVNDFSAKNLPPVRTVQRVSTTEEKNRVGERHTTKASVPRSYAEWDRFDVDKELKKLDPDEQQAEKRTEVKRTLDIEKSVSVEGYSLQEQELLAEMEKLKGNEAFRSADYSEAVLYYGRSLSLTKSPKVLNNRAQAHLKMKNYWAAVLDCNKVLSMEPDNIKALFRRGLAYAGSEEYPLAILDLKQVLELDPGNKAAKEELLKLKKRCIHPTDKKTVSIEVLEAEESEGGGGDNEEVGFPLPIEDVSSGINCDIREKIRETIEDSDEEVFGELSQRARDMLSICNRKTRSGKANVGGISKVSSRSLKPTRESSSQSSVAGIDEAKISRSSPSLVADCLSTGLDENKCSKSSMGDSSAVSGVDCLLSSTDFTPVLHREQDCGKDLTQSNFPVREDNSALVGCRTVADNDRHSKKNLTPVFQNTHSRSSGCTQTQTEMGGESDICETGVQVPDDVSMRPPEESCPKETLSNGRALRESSHQSTSEHTTTSSSKEIHSDTSGIESRAELQSHSMDSSSSATTEHGRSLVLHPKLSNEKIGTAGMHPSELVSPVEFRRLWSAGGPRSALLSVRPDRLPALLSSELDGTMLHDLLMAAARIVREGRVSLGVEILKHLARAERLQLAALLLSDRERRGVAAFLSRLEQEHQLDISWLRDALSISDAGRPLPPF